MIQEIRELHQLRLDRNLSYRELGELIGMSERGVRVLLTSDEPKPWERTLFKIRKFLAAQSEQEAQVVSQ